MSVSKPSVDHVFCRGNPARMPTVLALWGVFLSVSLGAVGYLAAQQSADAKDAREVNDRVIANETNIVAIKSDIKEIKEDVKDLNRKVDEGFKEVLRSLP